MNTELVVALAAGAFSMVATALSVLANGRIARSNDEAAARRAYEYEARKRLYDQVEPLLFQLESAAAQARDRGLNLARAARMGVLGAQPESWLAQREYYLASTLYALIRPAVTFRLLERRMTSIDLNLDHRTALVFALLREFDRAISADFDLAACAPALDYNPNDTSELPVGDGARFRQGLVSGRRENLVDALIVREPGEAARAMSFGEMEEALVIADGPVSARLSPLISILEGFSPETRPVFWRIVITQVVLARLIVDVLDGRRLRGSLEAAARRLLDNVEFRRSLSTAEVGMEAPDPAPFEAASVYLTPRLASIGKRFAQRGRARA